jgi:hypothetical protein
MSLMDFVVSPPGCGWSVTEFWDWDAHEAQLCCPDKVDGDIYKYEVPGGALNLNPTKLPTPWSPRGPSLSRKNPHGRTGNRTRDLMISSQKLWPLDHEAGHLNLKFRRNKNDHEKGTAHRHTVISPLQQPLKQRFTEVTSFTFLEIVLFTISSVETNNFGSFFPSRLDRRN